MKRCICTLSYGYEISLLYIDFRIYFISTIKSVS